MKVNVYRCVSGQEILQRKNVPLSWIFPDGTEMQSHAAAYLDRAGRYWLCSPDDVYLLTIA